MSDFSTLNELLETRNSEELRELIALAQSILARREASETADASRRMVKFDSIRVVKDKSGQYIMAITPYHPDLVKECRALNGKWQSGNSAWVFDVRDEDRVRQMVSSVFGTDGSEPVEVVDVHVVITGDNGGDKDLFALGRKIAERRGRDARVQLGDGVTVVDGRFPASAGSAKYPRLVLSNPVTVLVRDVPAHLAQSAIDDSPEVYQIV